MSDKIYWVGMRESEIHYVKNFFEDSITVFGEEKENRIKPLNQYLNINLNHNNEKNDDVITHYLQSQMNNVLAKYPDAKFMFYNQIKALEYYTETRNIICLNKPDLINNISNKLFAREHFKTKVPCLPHYILYGKEINYEKLTKLFNVRAKFIVQSESSSGGSGTLVFYDDSQKALLEDDNQYLVTEYYEGSIPTNTHLMISKNETIVLPSSVQVIENQYDHLVYKGCDFIQLSLLADATKEKMDRYAKIIGDDLRKRGYLGVLGIDFIICDDEVFFIEINSRFQNSSTVLNKALVENGQPSLQEMNYNCFKTKIINYQPIPVGYSAYIMDFDEQVSSPPKIQPIEVLDQMDSVTNIEKLSYWKTNIYDKSITRFCS